MVPAAPCLALCITLSLAGCASRSRIERHAPPPTTHTEHPSNSAPSDARSLSIGQTWTIQSALLGEQRRINTFVPTVYGEKIEGPLPTLYLLDGGIDEDFLHIAGLVQVLVSNGTMRPTILIGIENTQRRRDMTGPTSNPEDLKIAPVVGGSAVFRRFLKEELRPAVQARLKTTDESAIIGESLAGLFVLETLVSDPGMFSAYIAVDPSLWWANESLLSAAGTGIPSAGSAPPAIWVVTSGEPSLAPLARRLAETIGALPDHPVRFELLTFPDETHATIFHPAALAALRRALPPSPGTPK